METEYRGYAIDYLEHSNQFRIEIGDGEKYVPSLTEAKEYIDALEKKGFERFVVWVRTGYGAYRYEEATVTSVNRKYGEVWTSTKKDKRRSKKVPSELVADTPENREVIAMIHALNEEIKAREKTVAGLAKDLTAHVMFTDG